MYRHDEASFIYTVSEIRESTYKNKHLLIHPCLLLLIISSQSPSINSSGNHITSHHPANPVLSHLILNNPYQPTTITTIIPNPSPQNAHLNPSLPSPLHNHRPPIRLRRLLQRRLHVPRRLQRRTGLHDRRLQ